MRIILLLLSLFGLAANISAQTRHYVKAGAGGNGDSWLTASGDLQQMINIASAGDSIFVAKGTYLPNRSATDLQTITPNNRDNAFVLKKGIKIYGGFAGTETSLKQRDLSIIANSSLLSGDFGVMGDSSDNAYHVVISAGDLTGAELNGFTIEKGFASSANGGAVILSGYTFFHIHGGGIYINSSTPMLANLCIRHNSASGSGGGLYLTGAVNLPLSYLKIINNHCASLGAGLFSYQSSYHISNAIICSNTSNYLGGGLYNDVSNSSLSLVTISKNDATNSGGGIYNYYTNLQITNSIIWGNTSNAINEIDAAVSDSIIKLSNTLYMDGDNNVSRISNPDDPSNIKNQDPQFVDPANGNYTLKPTSPAIDAGENSYLAPNDTLDLSGLTRIDGAAVDLGAYEYSQGISLPVNIASFKGQIHKNKIAIQWQSGVEQGIDHYAIEKSIDDHFYIPIVLRQPMGSDNAYSISTTQQEPSAYYRLAIINNNGVTTFYKKILKFSLKSVEKFFIYPNPASDYIYIKISVAGNLQLFNAAGKKERQEFLQPGTHKINVSNLSKGVYFGQINGAKFKFIKE